MAKYQCTFKCCWSLLLLVLLVQNAVHTTASTNLSCYNEDIADYLESHLATKTPYRMVQNSNTDNMTEYKGK